MLVPPAEPPAAAAVAVLRVVVPRVEGAEGAPFLPDVLVVAARGCALDGRLRVERRPPLSARACAEAREWAL